MFSQASVEGTRNILNYVEPAGVEKFVLISSIVAVTDSIGRDPSPLVTDKCTFAFPGVTCGVLKVISPDWAAVTREIALDPTSSSFAVYAAEKKLAEQALWAWADEHPKVDVSAGMYFSRLCQIFELTYTLVSQ